VHEEGGGEERNLGKMILGLKKDGGA